VLGLVEGGGLGVGGGGGGSDDGKGGLLVFGGELVFDRALLALPPGSFNWPLSSYFPLDCAAGCGTLRSGSVAFYTSFGSFE
jgi:hypothetical protein